jgi:hypothetical protein
MVLAINSVLDWNPQGGRRGGRPRKSWRRTIEEEITKMGKDLEKC